MKYRMSGLNRLIRKHATMVHIRILKMRLFDMAMQILRPVFNINKP